MNSRSVLQRGHPRHVKRLNKLESRLRTRIVADLAVALDRAGMRGDRDITFLAVGPASERVVQRLAFGEMYG
jgi:hypothetical protein